MTPPPSPSRAPTIAPIELAHAAQRHRGRLYAAALSIVGTPMDAEDVLQDALIRAFRGLHGFRGQSELTTWLYRITVNTALNHLRRRRRCEALSRKLRVHTQIASPPRAHFESDSSRAVFRAIAALPRIFGIPLYLTVFEGMTYQSIALALGVPEGTVAWRISRARYLLREILNTGY